MMRYFAWSLAVLGVCGVLGFSAYHFHEPRILFGLLALYFMPSPYDYDAGDGTPPPPEQ